MSTLRASFVIFVGVVVLLLVMQVAKGSTTNNVTVKSAPAENVTFCYTVRNLHVTYDSDYVKRTVLQTDGTYLVSYVPTSGSVTYITNHFACIDYVK